MGDPKLEDLLKLLEGDEIAPIENLVPAEQFIAKFVKSHPTEIVTTEIIYYFYCLWCAEQPIKPLAIRRFFAHFTGKFRKGNTAYDKFYYIEKTPFYLSDEDLLEFKRQRRMFNRMEEKICRRKKQVSAQKADQRTKDAASRKQQKLKEKLQRNQEKRETILPIRDLTKPSSQK